MLSPVSVRQGPSLTKSSPESALWSFSVSGRILIDSNRRLGHIKLTRQNPVAGNGKEVSCPATRQWLPSVTQPSHPRAVRCLVRFRSCTPMPAAALRWTASRRESREAANRRAPSPTALAAFQTTPKSYQVLSTRAIAFGFRVLVRRAPIGPR